MNADRSAAIISFPTNYRGSLRPGNSGGRSPTKKVRRGPIAGLFSTSYLSSMVNISPQSFRRIFYSNLKRKGVLAKDITPREILKFLILLDSLNKDAESQSILDKLF